MYAPSILAFCSLHAKQPAGCCSQAGSVLWESCSCVARGEPFSMLRSGGTFNGMQLACLSGKTDTVACEVRSILTLASGTWQPSVRWPHRRLAGQQCSLAGWCMARRRTRLTAKERGAGADMPTG